MTNTSTTTEITVGALMTMFDELHRVSAKRTLHEQQRARIDAILDSGSVRPIGSAPVDELQLRLHIARERVERERELERGWAKSMIYSRDGRQVGYSNSIDAETGGRALSGRVLEVRTIERLLQERAEFVAASDADLRERMNRMNGKRREANETEREQARKRLAAMDALIAAQIAKEDSNANAN
jgi:hypothetical protein